MTRLALALLTATALNVEAAQAASGRFDGWCFPADACTGEDMAIRNDRFYTCEEECDLTEPIDVVEMNAVLYWVRCSGDHGVRPPFRMLLAEYGTTDTLRAISVSNEVVEELVPCNS